MFVFVLFSFFQFLLGGSGCAGVNCYGRCA